MSENFRPNVCGKYALQGSSRALYTPLDPTHKQCTWPVPFHEAGCAVLIWSGAVMDDSLCTDLIWWSSLTMVWCGSWCMVWSGADLTACRCGLVPWPNLEDWLRKMVCSDDWKLKTWIKIFARFGSEPNFFKSILCNLEGERLYLPLSS